MPGTNTPFTPLWTDSADAQELLAQKLANGTVPAKLKQSLADLIEHGYAVIPRAISAGLANKLAAEIMAVQQEPEHFIARRSRVAYAHPTPEVVQDDTFRLIDFHVNSANARKAIFARPIMELLLAVFEKPANAFQCLTFIHGSQQVPHQDGAYVVVSQPLQFLASWIALEDITPGSGELMYYEGSHRLDDFLFEGGSKSWNPARHGREIHQEFLQSIVQRSEASGMPLKTFLPKKGDALIWASDLVHGGSKATNSNTRKSMVAHYCPIGVQPKFSTFTDFYHPRPVSEHAYISSRHYDLTTQQSDGLFRKAPKLLPAFMGKVQQASDGPADADTSERPHT